MKLLVPEAVDDTTLDSTNVAETVAAWNSGTTYAAGDQVRLDATHRIYESAQGSNLNHNPATDDGTWWLDAGPTNPWAMFDESLNTVTSNADTIEFQVSPTLRTSGVAFFGLAGAFLTLAMTVPGDGLVYDETFDLVSYDNVGSYFDYFFEPIIRKTELFIDDLPLYAGAEIAVTVDNTGATAEVGNFVIGARRQIGTTLYGARFGIIDHSRKETDDFGITTLVERSYRSTATLRVAIEKAYVNELKRLLAERRAKLTVFSGDDGDEYPALLIYGFPKSWDATIEHPTVSFLDIQLEGVA